VTADHKPRLRTLRKSSKLDNVCYDIRGPVMARARQMEEEGHRIIKLNIGNPAPFGFEAPEEIVQDVILNLPNASGYSDSKGLFSARKAIMHETQRKGIPGVQIDDIFIGNGVSELIVMAMQALLNNGDEVLVPAPDYPLWTAAVSLGGGKPRHYLCDEGAGWLPDLDDIRSKITSNTRAIVIINPNNPTGALYPTELLLEIIEIARQHQLIVYADEIYDKVLYDGVTHTSIGLAGRRRADRHLQRPVEELPRLRLPCRLAGRVGRQAPRQGLPRRAEHAGVDAPVLQRAGQYGIQTALGGYQSINDLVAPSGRLTRQRDLAHELLTLIPGVSCVKPKAAMYLFPSSTPSCIHPRRPEVHPQPAGRGARAGGAGQRLQLAASGPHPRGVPAARRRFDRGDFGRMSRFLDRQRAHR
jgi:alanine-synthesizing transaminase